MSNEALLQEFKQVLLKSQAQPSQATDPFAAAWAWRGAWFSKSGSPYGFMAFKGPNIRVILLAIATLQQEEFIITPRHIYDQLGGLTAYSTLTRTLKRLCNMNHPWYGWLTETPSPLMRKRYGRTYRYWLVDPQPVE